jgi:hypothetical protein
LLFKREWAWKLRDEREKIGKEKRNRSHYTPPSITRATLPEWPHWDAFNITKESGIPTLMKEAANDTRTQ